MDVSTNDWTRLEEQEEEEEEEAWTMLVVRQKRDEDDLAGTGRQIYEAV